MKASRFALNRDEKRRGLGGRDSTDGVVLARCQAAQLQHLTQDQDQAALLSLGDRGRGLEAGDHRGAVRVVGVVQQPRSAREGEQPEAAVVLSVTPCQRIEGAVEERLTNRLLGQRSSSSHCGQGRVHASLAEQRRLHAELVAFEEIAGQGELRAVVGCRHLADDPQVVLPSAIAELLPSRRALQLSGCCIVIPIDDRDLAGRREQGAFFIGHRVQGADALRVGGSDERDDPDIGQRDGREASDLAGCVHPKLHDADLVPSFEPEEHHREAHEIVQVAGRRVDDADPVQQRGDGLAGGGLASGSRDGDDQSAPASRREGPAAAVKPREIAQGVERVANAKDRCRLVRGDVSGHNDAARTRAEGSLDVVVAVEVIAPQRDEQATLRDASGVRDNGREHAGSCRGPQQRSARGDADFVDGKRSLVGGDRRGHQVSASKAPRRTAASAVRASSRSSNARVVAPMIW